MKKKPFAISLACAFASMLAMCVSSSAQQETILLDLTLNFGVGGDPQAQLLRDADGNLYGTTAFGGPEGGGAVFELVRGPNGTWSRKVLYPFKIGQYDGQRPQAGIIFDAAGNLYGTTYFGGLYNQGTVFELMPQNGLWKQKRLHSFGGIQQDGKTPDAAVIFDSLGNLYGTTLIGGEYNLGTVYELIAQSDGTWKEKILHTFNEDGTDGFAPVAGLVMDGRGNLYGATSIGGAYDAGIVFELLPTPDGEWKENILHNFALDGVDGTGPFGTLIFGTAGNLYGTTIGGGANGKGTAFELSPEAKGVWTETILHDFGAGSDGENPGSGLIFDRSSNLYGVTESGGAYNKGTAFELSPAPGGGWTEILLHNFGSSGDGIAPVGSLIFDPAGNLYGTTDEGGTTGYGTVYEITP